MDRWRNKVAVVTGASSGIGEAIARKLVEEGLQVIGMARRVGLVQKVSAQLNGKSGKLLALKCDVTNEDDIRNCFKWILDNVGPVQVLVNNAAFSAPGTIIEGDSAMLKKVIDTNLFGTVLCTKAAIAHMRSDNLEGHIININSILGHRVVIVPDQPFNIYPSTKYGITALTEMLSQELRDFKMKVKVSSISPGLVSKTELFDVAEIASFNQDTIKQMPHLFPEDIANGIAYVLGTPPHVQVQEMIVKPLGEFL